ncbi:MAG: DNA (cytosine-5-)-methyltransferase [Chloroflexi bacterium]|nr:DNA (cytosine-5-)-methyltransferase [Chloroflexota bacterium]
MCFVDLFAGLGGFHLALRKLGHTCVFASEIDETLRDVYEKNFGMRPEGDIRNVHASEIPPHEILCAGFPCQPFSKAGSQEGFDDPELGGLYKDILRIIRHHRPRYVILENVPNLQNHDEGKTWEIIEGRLRREDYDVQLKRLSPHHFGIPQIRERIYIVGSTRLLDGFAWPEHVPANTQISIRSVLDSKPPEARPLPEQVKRCLEVWQEFVNRIPKDEKIPHPLWSMEFGATYPYEDTTPSALSTDELRRYRGSHGLPLREATDREEIFNLLPSHAITKQASFPSWKVQFIRRNREFYQRHKTWVDRWLPKIVEFPSSFQKLEWNCQGESIRRLDRYVVQLRASGVRVKRPTTAPSLVAMTATQVPIITWESRYMTPTECKRLQSMQDLRWLPESPTKAYEALGNAVNVEVARHVAAELVGQATGLRALLEPIAAYLPLKR